MFQSLSSRATSLPLVLAGPIVRKVTENEASVWVALKERKSIKMTINNVANNTLPASDLIQVGVKLFIGLVTVKTSLTPGQSYNYDLCFDGPGNCLSTLGVVSNDPNIAERRKVLCYGTNLYPTFIVPPRDLDKLSIAHSSCRKPHGGASYSPKKDALHLLDKVFEDNRKTNPAFPVNKFSNVSKQPHPQQLFLTGDQIYADDVHPLLLTFIRDAVKVLIDPNYMARKEQIWTVDTDIVQAHFEPGNRAELVLKKAGYTCGWGKYGHNQLIHAPEYFMMYLFVWSDVLWPVGFESDAYYKSIPNLKVMLDKTLKYQHVLDSHSGVFNVQTFSGTLKQVRRVFANIATYMMFDDHDVTDDWFLNYHWCNDVLKVRPLGKYMVRNGLMAFALFQAWGNKPDYFNPKGHSTNATTAGIVIEAGGSLLTDIQSWYLTDVKNNTSVTKADTATEVTINAAIIPKIVSDTDDTFPNKGGKRLSTIVNWHFDINFYTFQLVALDTRTKRGFLNKDSFTYAKYAPAALICSKKMSQQIPNKVASSKLTILLSPAPVLGMSFIEDGQKTAIIEQNEKYKAHPRGTERGESYMDAEPWAFHQRAWDSLIYKLIPHHRVLIVSGDVHYAFSAAGQIFDYTDGTNSMEVISDGDPSNANPSYYEVGTEPPTTKRRTLKIMQCVSSSAKNEERRTGLDIKHVDYTNAGIHFRGSNWEAIVTDERDTNRYHDSGILSPTTKPPVALKIDEHFSDPRIQIFNNTWGLDEDPDNFRYFHFPPRQYNVDYLKDERYQINREESRDNERYCTGYNNVGIVRFTGWFSGNNIIQHVLIYQYKDDEPFSTTLHEYKTKDDLDIPYSP